MELFYYSQTQISAPTEEDLKAGRTRHFEKITDFFDPNIIVRGRIFADGSGLVLLNDGHEHQEVKPLKQGASKVGPKQWVQSEIMLSPKDMKRLKHVTDLYNDSDFTEFLSEDNFDAALQETEPFEDRIVDAAIEKDVETEEVEMPQIGPNDKY